MKNNSTGKRKSAIAKVAAYHPTTSVPKVLVNGKDFNEYFKIPRLSSVVLRPFDCLNTVLTAVKEHAGVATESIASKISSYKLTQGETDYINSLSTQEAIELSDILTELHFNVEVCGGGLSAQAGAVMHGMAKVIDETNTLFRKLLRIFGLLTRDPRIVERKKSGRRKARKVEQYSKR